MSTLWSTCSRVFMFTGISRPVNNQKSGTSRPSQANQAAFDLAVREVAAATQRLLDTLVTTAPPKDREVEAAKAKARSAARYG